MITDNARGAKPFTVGRGPSDLNLKGFEILLYDQVWQRRGCTSMAGPEARDRKFYVTRAGDANLNHIDHVC